MWAKEDPKDSEAKIQDLRSMIQGVGEIQCPLDDWYLLRSLRCTHFVLNDAYNQMKHLYNLQQSMPDLFSGINDPNFLKWVVESKVFSLLPSKAVDGSSVIIGKIKAWNPSTNPLVYFQQIIVICTLTAAMDPEIQKNGIHLVVDADVTWQHFRACGYKGLHFIAHYSEDCAPCWFKGLHIVNESFVANWSLKIIGSFATKGLIKNHKCYGRNFEQLFNLVPKEVLPEEFGGLAGSMDCANLIESILELKI